MADDRERIRPDSEPDVQRTLPASPYGPIGTVSGNLSARREEEEEGQRSGVEEGRWWREYFATFAATMGNMIMGTTIAWSGPVIPQLQLSPEQDGFNISDEQGSWIGSLMPLGALVGSQIGGLLMAKLGRKGTMLADAFIFAFSFLLIVVSPTLWLVYIGRFMTGIATGISTVSCPVYVGETASSKSRGLLGSSLQVMVVIGVLLCFLVGNFSSWRWLSVASIGYSVVWAVLLLLVPESPVEYMARRKFSAARKSLEWLRGTIHVDAEFEEIQLSLEHSGPSAGMKDLLKKQNLTPLLISMYLMLGQQFSGMNAVLFYVVDIFKAADSSLGPSTESIIIALVQVVITVLAALFMDKLGRRVLLCLSALFMFISISALGAFFYIKVNLNNEELAEKLQVLPVISLSVFVMMFSVGFGPIPWLMMSELFAPEVKGAASSLAAGLNWSLAFIVTKFFANMVAALTEAVSFWIYGGVSAVTFLFCLFFVPETKGKSLDAIQALFRTDTPYFLEIGLWKWCQRSDSDSDLQFLVDAENEE